MAGPRGGPTDADPALPGTQVESSSEGGRQKALRTLMPEGFEVRYGSEADISIAGRPSPNYRLGYLVAALTMLAGAYLA